MLCDVPAQAAYFENTEVTTARRADIVTFNGSSHTVTHTGVDGANLVITRAVRCESDQAGASVANCILFSAL